MFKGSGLNSWSAVLREAHVFKSTSQGIRQGGSAQSLQAALLLGFVSGLCFALFFPFFSVLSIASYPTTNGCGPGNIKGTLPSL